MTSQRVPRCSLLTMETFIELVGREAHPADEKVRDLRRDNCGSSQATQLSLRYGWRDVAGEFCAVTAQVAVLLHSPRVERLTTTTWCYLHAEPLRNVKIYIA